MKEPVTLNVLGKHNVSNALAAIAIGLRYDVPMSAIKAQLSTFFWSGFIATTKVTDLFITGELSRHYIEEAWKENPSLHTRAFSSNGELIAFLETYLKKNDVVLIKGSNGMNLKEVSKALMA